MGGDSKLNPAPLVRRRGRETRGEGAAMWSGRRRRGVGAGKAGEVGRGGSGFGSGDRRGYYLYYFLRVLS
jgi:hypothetical protein|uniref:Uncharacterized protein n=1 Tax=Oryza sativa subsp. japonica TaxID=39947 RepID=Q6K7S4_ORYSJ|nr:hypothetical protein [Oryza sativa Japonica Group]BAD23038.1 hypothetical protein [Oryza sativa Japonica Group]